MKDFRLQQLLKTLSIIPSIETLWYPHCGWDVQFINSKLMQTHLPSPNFYILNDTMNISLDSYIKKDKDFNLLSSTNVQLTDISKKAIWYNVKSIFCVQIYFSKHVFYKNMLFFECGCIQICV